MQAGSEADSADLPHDQVPEAAAHSAAHDEAAANSTSNRRRFRRMQRPAE